jgi:iron-sulfur cluster insertion protein
MGMSTETPSDSDQTGIEFTDAAIQEARTAMEEESVDPSENGLRVVAKEKDCDCGSMAYGMHFANDPSPEDEVFTHDGLQVFVDPQSYEYVEGATVDYVVGPQGSGFVVEVADDDDSGCCGGQHHHH